MKIAVHAKVLSEQQFTGIGVYTYNLLKSLAALDKDNQYTLYSNEPFRHKIEAPNFKEKILNFPNLWTYLRLPFEFVSGNYDLLFVPKEVVPPVKRPKTIVSCFDLGYDIKGLFSERISLDARAHIWITVNYALKAADRIIAISESTKQDIIRLCGVDPEKIHVIYLGYDTTAYRPIMDREIIDSTKRKYGIDSGYIINPSSTLWYRKNLLGLLRAFHLVKSRDGADCKLVITGKKGKAKDEGKISELVEELGIKKDVIFTGYVPFNDMPVLLSGADAMIFPSLYEGFGLPIVEAMGCGCPIITSNISAMPEVAGDAGLLVDPYDINDIAAAIEKVCNNPLLRIEMRNKSLERARFFSWESTARKTLNLFESCR